MQTRTIHSHLELELEMGESERVLGNILADSQPTGLENLTGHGTKETLTWLLSGGRGRAKARPDDLKTFHVDRHRSRFERNGNCEKIQSSRTVGSGRFR